MSEFSDPYEGQTLAPDWIQMLSDHSDVHEIGDYALTRFYDPTTDFGIGNAWIAIDKSLDNFPRNALLGRTIGPATNPFDPGKMGSYVQTITDVVHSLSVLRDLNDDRLEEFVNLLNQCARRGMACTSRSRMPNNKALHAEPPIARFLKSSSLAAAG